MARPARLTLLLVSLICLGTATMAWAQVDRGTLTGTVTDSSGGLVPGATVKAVHVATNFERTVTTSDQGSYTIPQLPVGASRRRHHRRRVPAGHARQHRGHRRQHHPRRRQTLARRPPGRDHRVGRSQGNPGRQRQGDHRDHRQIHPGPAARRRRHSSARRSISSLIAPEAKTGTSGDGGRGNIVIGGGQEGGWDLTVDGVSATPGAPFEQRLWTTLNSPSVEAITEFAVDTNGFKAEFGHAGGGAVSFVSRSATNQWRGKVFEFMRDDAFDSNDYFSKALGRAKPQLSQHDFGGVFGGPVMIPKLYNGRDKTFFFAAYEAYRNKTSAAPRVATIPTAEMYNGDFSNWRDASGNLIPIYDPRTTRANPNGPGFIRDAFPGNRIPLDRFSSISREVLQLATMRPDLPGVRNNFAYTPGDLINTNPWNKFSVKIDHNLSSKDRIGLLVHWGEVLVVPPSSGPGGGLPVPLNNFRDEDSHTYVYRANWDRVISPNLLNRVTFGHNNWYQLRASYNRDQGWGTHIGLKNVPSSDLLFPLLDFSDEYLDWGRSEWGGSGNYLWAVSDDLT